MPVVPAWRALHNATPFTKYIPGSEGKGRMNILPKYILNVGRPGLLSTMLYTVKGVFRNLIGFFKLTEEERLMAGIYIDNNERE